MKYYTTFKKRKSCHLQNTDDLQNITLNVIAQVRKRNNAWSHLNVVSKNIEFIGVDSRNGNYQRLGGDSYQGIYDFSHEEKIIKRSIIQIGNYSMILFY